MTSVTGAVTSTGFGQGRRSTSSLEGPLMPRTATDRPPRTVPDGSPATLPPAGLDRAHRRGLLVRLGVWAAIAAGPLALFTSCASAPVPRTAAHTAAPTAPATVGADPAGFAQMFVSLWLRATSTADDAQSRAVRAMAPGVDLLTDAQNAQTAQSAQGGPSVAQTAVIRSAQIQPGYWSVVVAAELGSGSTLQVRYFTVPVQTAASAGSGVLGAMTVAAAPAEVAAPTSGGTAQTVYALDAAPGSALAQSASGFLQAYLTGAGATAPLLAPGVQIAPLSPAPYAQLQVLSVGVDRAGMDGPVPADGTTAEVWVQVDGTDPAGSSWPLRYALRMRARAGRWEVAALEPGPLLTAAQPSTPTPVAVPVAPNPSTATASPASP
ncbi:conjugal transfer protein [Streptacidiphilus sp. EB129]|uniref:conjugal transfer protein n=1 Tax=Streptacidiphilus sp. EB129 TaxID=3156262 RepID=UPI0035186573